MSLFLSSISIVYLTIYAQEDYVIESLFVSPFATGSTTIIQDIDIINIEKEEIKVNLLGSNITDIAIVDDNPIDYAFINGNEVLLKDIDTENIRITYKTSDIIEKKNREWLLAINSTTNFMVMLPNGAIINFLEKSPSSLRLVGSQHLLMYESGPTKIRYTINESRQ